MKRQTGKRNAFSVWQVLGRTACLFPVSAKILVPCVRIATSVGAKYFAASRLVRGLFWANRRKIPRPQ